MKLPTLVPRAAKAKLELARIKISCFFTNKRSIIRPPIYRGIKIAGELRRDGSEVMEVYPHTSKVAPAGDESPPKNSLSSLPYMKEWLAQLVEGLNPLILRTWA